MKDQDHQVQILNRIRKININDKYHWKGNQKLKINKNLKN
jgi:hypothetical protein